MTKSSGWSDVDRTGPREHAHVMKSHISATIDAKLVVELNRIGQEERRSRSQLIEMALEAFLRGRNDTRDEIITSEGRFKGSFSREDTYGR